jgi:methionyl-tRNA synthetase
MDNYMNGFGGAFVPGVMAGWLSFLIIPITIWSLFWMALALWKAARNDSKIWFIILLLVHTMGILDIIYIFLISKKPKVLAKKKSK